MAVVERNGGGWSPVGFNKLMTEAGFQRMELNGFTGDMSAKINKWHKRGLGRAIGYPLFDKDGKTKRGDFRGLMYVLPLTDTDEPTIYQSSLLIIPTEKSCRFAIIVPKKSAYIGEAARKNEETKNAENFHRIFSPSKDPFYPKEWNPKNAKTQLDEIFKNPSVLDASIDIRTEIPVNNVQPFLEKALQNAEIIAERNAERDRVRNIPVDEQSLQETLGADLVKDLDLFNEIFLRGGDRQRQVTAGVGEFLDTLEHDLVADLEAGIKIVGSEDLPPGNDF
jgi:hypothetical protein